MKIKYYLLLFTLLFSAGAYAQDTTVVDSFIIDDVMCMRKATKDIVVTVAADRVRQFGSYVRVKIEVINLRENRVNFMTNDMSAYIVNGDKKIDTEICSFDKFMKIIRTKRILFGDFQTMIDNPITLVYPIDKEVSTSIYNSRGRNRFTYGTAFEPVDTLGKGVVKHQTGSTINNSDQDRTYTSRNIKQYKLTLERNYLRSNTLQPFCATGGIIMVKYKNGSDFNLTIKVEDVSFDFGWKIDDIRKFKNY